MNKDSASIVVEASLWAKKNEKNGKLQWLPLQQHLIDTMNVSGLLWEHWLSNGQRRLITDSMNGYTEEKAKQLVRFLGAIHDIGKATPVFQTMDSFHRSDDLQERLLNKLERAGFTDISNLRLLSPNRSHHGLSGQTLLDNFGVRKDIASVVGGHHGKPIEEKHSLQDIQLRAYPANYYQKESADHPIHIKWDRVQRDLLQWALGETGFDRAEDLPAIEQPILVLLEGLLIMADWIASNEEYFPLIPIDEGSEGIDQSMREREGWCRWFSTTAWSPQESDDVEEFYKTRFAFSPRDVQRKLAEAIADSINPGLFIIEAPMGVGKTEAALAAVELIAAKTGHSGMYFGLPTQATSDGVFVRIKDWLSGVTEYYGESESLQLVHGKAALNEDFKGIAKNVDIDGAMDGSVIINEWFSGKKTAILDDFVVGTVDHFLLAALKQKHLALRHLGFSKKIVVIDEVHAYDAYMGQYLYRALYWMGVYKVPVLILSATLPAARRVELVENYVRGTGKKWKQIEKPNGWDITSAYPLISYTDENQVKQIVEFEPPVNREIRVQGITDEELYDALGDLLKDGGIAGVVVNTVKRAQQIAKKLSEQFGDNKVELLHSAFLATHRRKKEKELLQSIGKNAVRPDLKIVVGTQVIEQSLDIDFDVLISDLAPMDLLLQRVGRLHRNTLPHRPDKLKHPRLYVLGNNADWSFEEGASVIYGNYLLMRTQYHLPEIIRLPDDISVLVQKVYGEGVLLLSEEQKERYETAQKQNKTIIAQKKQRADNFRLAEPNQPDKNSLIEWLKNVHPEDSEEKGFAQVRDSAETIEVIAVQRCGSGYTFIGNCTDISTNIDNFDVAKKLATQTVKLPNPLCASYAIDRTIEELEELNRNYLSHWQNQSWLRGSLGIILDEDRRFRLNSWVLTYSEAYGLEYEKEVELGPI